MQNKPNCVQNDLGATQRALKHTTLARQPYQSESVPTWCSGTSVTWTQHPPPHPLPLLTVCCLAEEKKKEAWVQTHLSLQSYILPKSFCKQISPLHLTSQTLPAPGSLLK